MKKIRKQKVRTEKVSIIKKTIKTKHNKRKENSDSRQFSSDSIKKTRGVSERSKQMMKRKRLTIEMK